MKKLLIAICFVLLNVEAQNIGNQPSESWMVRRIDLKEKFNLGLTSLPPELIKNFCKKNITGYYPKKKETAVEFASFLYHFGGDIIDFEKIPSSLRPCALSYCEEIDPFLLGCFDVYLDVHEKITYNRNTKTSNVEPFAIQLIFSSACDQRGIESQGPIFVLSEIYSTLKDLRISNTQNDAFSFTLEQVFTQRLYHATITHENEKLIEKPSQQEWKNRRRQLEQKNNLNEY